MQILWSLHHSFASNQIAVGLFHHQKKYVPATLHNPHSVALMPAFSLEKVRLTYLQILISQWLYYTLTVSHWNSFSKKYRLKAPYHSGRIQPTNTCIRQHGDAPFPRWAAVASPRQMILYGCNFWKWSSSLLNRANFAL